MNDQGTQFEGAKIEAVKPAPAPVFPGTILKEIRSWAFTLLVLGGLHIGASGFLSAPWGILLILVGLASFYFRSSAMLVIYAVTLIWAGISNLTSGQAIWIGGAFIQWYLALRIFRTFVRFQETETKVAAESNSNELTPRRVAAVFPWAATLLGVLSFLGLIGIFAIVIVLVAVSGSSTVPSYFGFIEGLVVNAGVLGFAVGLASLLCRHPGKGLAIAGMVTGVLTLLIELVLRFL
jgi:hypothetical protein